MCCGTVSERPDCYLLKAACDQHVIMMWWLVTDEDEALNSLVIEVCRWATTVPVRAHIWMWEQPTGSRSAEPVKLMKQQNDMFVSTRVDQPGHSIQHRLQLGDKREYQPESHCHSLDGAAWVTEQQVWTHTDGCSIAAVESRNRLTLFCRRKIS